MKKTRKTGFTIVELVIVIAVIAILAAVLIPTFSGLIKKANLSNDKSFVRNMNTTLAAEGALEKFNSAGDAINALNRNGFSGKYNTYSSGYHYCYSLENNRMYLLDDSNVVVYPEEDVAVSSLWGLYTDNRVSVTTGVTKYVAMTNITNSVHYNEVFASGTYTIDLNDYMIAVDSELTNVTAKDGIVIKGATAGEGVNKDYDLVVTTTTNSRGELTVYDAQLREIGEVNGNVVTIKNKIFTDRVHVNNDRVRDYVFENCIFYNQGIQFDDATGVQDGASGTINNCQFVDIVEGQWALISNRSITISNTTFTKLNKRGAIQIHESSSDMSIAITGCTFDGTAGEYPLIRLVGETESIASFTLSDCEFIDLNKSKGIIGFSGEGSCLYNYTGAAGQPTVTFSNNKFGEKINDKYLVGGATGNTLGSLLRASAK